MTHRPASMDLDAVREGLEAAVVAAGESILDMLRRGTVRVSHKRGEGPVTEADHAADDVLHERLMPLIDGAQWLSEESRQRGALIHGAPTWIVDPLDGTRNFASANPHVCVNLALTHGDRLVLGLTYDPFREELFHAIEGGGAFLNGERIFVSEQDDLSECVLGTDMGYLGDEGKLMLNMLSELGTRDRIPLFIARAKDKDDPFRLMGFGHRVYKNFDPRAKVLRDTCHEVLQDLGVTDEPMLEIALELEKIALEDPYFIKRKLYPNVDFYSGIILRAMGIPPHRFTVIFAVARTVGWVAQWAEMMNDPSQKIGRPRQLYTGYGPRKYVPLNRRRRKD